MRKWPRSLREGGLDGDFSFILTVENKSRKVSIE